MKTSLKKVLPAAVAAFWLLNAQAAVVFDQPGGGAGWQSSWWSPNGSDYDQYTWDNFSISSNVPITEIKWHGGFFYGGTPVTSFTVSIYSSIQGGSQPDIGNTYAQNPLVSYTINGNAGQTPGGAATGVSYDYDYVLPTPFQAAAGTVYWIQIEAAQAGIPDWAIGVGAGGDGRCFRKFAYVADSYYSYAPGDAAFTLLAPDTTIYSVAASASPTNSGSIAGAGLFPTGMTASLVANPATNSAFVNWTENGAVIGTSPNYSFTVTSNRTLVANFTPGSTIATTIFPTVGGSVTGGGNIANGASATVIATPSPNYSFVNWTENGATVSTSASYTFTVTTNRALVANFTSASVNLAVLFSQPQGSGSIPSSYLYPDGIDGDGYAYDNFTFGADQDVTQIQWIGVYRYGMSASNPAFDFNIGIYSTTTNGVTRTISSTPLKSYTVGGNAFETPTAGGYFSYHFTLPSTFHAVAGATYWVQIEAQQTAYINDWGMAYASSGDGIFFYKATPGGVSPAAGDLTFTLLGPAGTNSSTVVTSARPASGGVTSGDGTFGNGVTDTVIATPNAGFIFSGWSENGAVVSTNANYSFAVTNNRTLSANFDPTFSVTLAASPTNAGTASGAGNYPARASVTVIATPNAGYSFINWTAAGVPMCATTNYTFTLNSAQALTANFALTPLMLNQTVAPGSLGLNWTPAVTGWGLQESPDLKSWTTSTQPVTTNGSQRSITIAPLSGNKFFRLNHP